MPPSTSESTASTAAEMANDGVSSLLVWEYAPKLRASLGTARLRAALLEERPPPLGARPARPPRRRRAFAAAHARRHYHRSRSRPKGVNALGTGRTVSHRRQTERDRPRSRTKPSPSGRTRCRARDPASPRARALAEREALGQAIDLEERIHRPAGAPHFDPRSCASSRTEIAKRRETGPRVGDRRSRAQSLPAQRAERTQANRRCCIR